MKISGKKTLRAAAITLCIFSVLFTALYGAAAIQNENKVLNQAEYQGIITVWQIDSFEGGTGSRRAFLAARAKEFSKARSGLLFLVTSHTVKGAEENFAQGIYPDVISFGAGVNVGNLKQLPNSLYDICGAVNGLPYAAAWCRGGYAFIKFNNKKVGDIAGKSVPSAIISDCEYTMPLYAAYRCGYKIENFKVLPSKNAYAEFTIGKTPFLLGTQRDVMRLLSRGADFSVFPLEYSDLYQYAAVSSVSAEKASVAVEFIEYLLSDKSQEKLCEISMLPVKEVAVAEELTSIYSAPLTLPPPLFLGAEKITEIKNDCEAFFRGDDAAETKLKNLSF